MTLPNLFRKITFMAIVLLCVAPLGAHAAVINDVMSGSVRIDDDTAHGPALSNYDLYGISVTGLGDLDGDGVEDIAVGAPGSDAGAGNSGAVYIHYLNTDASVDSTATINTSTTNGPTLVSDDFFGYAVANIGDLDGDGVTDIAVGAPNDAGTGTKQGSIYIHFLNTNGSVKSTAKITGSTTNGPSLEDNDEYGTSIAALGDLDGDGVEDIAVGAPKDDGDGTNRGAVYVHFLNTDGSVKSTVTYADKSTSNDLYGYAVANIGDLNGDDVVDLAVGVRGDDIDATDDGSVYVHFLNTDGSIDNTAKINSSTADFTSDNYDYLGSSVVGLGDLDGDGVRDLAIGAYYADGGEIAEGIVYLAFMNTDGSVDEIYPISSDTTDGPTLSEEDFYGKSLANIGDLDNDGVIDIAVGLPGYDDGSSLDEGAVYVHFLEGQRGSDPTAPRDTLAPLYRFWSDNYRGHFYTGNLAERDYVIANDSNWNYEGVVYDIYKTNNTKPTKPVYRFWSEEYKHHFYTISYTEATNVILYDRNWEYEGVAYYAYATNVSGTNPVYRFWSDNYRGHFYTASSYEKDYIIANDSNWAYEGVAWYVE